ncbi:unnamed protein product [Caretta caretta]
MISKPYSKRAKPKCAFIVNMSKMRARTFRETFINKPHPRTDLIHPPFPDTSLLIELYRHLANSNATEPPIGEPLA